MEDKLEEIITVYNEKKLKRAINQKISRDSLNILFTNCFCDFQINNRIIGDKIFDVCLIDETDNVIILFAKGAINIERIIEILEEYKVDFTSVNFNYAAGTHKFDYKNSKIHFVGNKEDLYNLLSKSSNRTCIFYPRMKAELSLQYLTEKSLETGKKSRFPIFSRECCGSIRFNDRTIFLVSEKDNGLETNKVIKMLDNLKIEHKIFSDYSSKR